MAKHKKKRNKKYSGTDAANARPTVTRVQAVSRSSVGQWLHEKQKILKTAGIALIVLAVIILIISGISSLF